jgi:polyhydroxybutyrate depolymerase
MSIQKLFPVCMLIATSLSAQPVRASSADIFVDTRNGPRHALVIPAGRGPHPTVIVLHGAFGTGAGTARVTGFAEAAARRNFVAVFPDGLDRKWHDGRLGGPAGPDDIGFIRALVARLVADQVADPRRIYLAGISNGGMMSFTLACKAPELFAGIGTVVANMPAGIEPCPARPLPVVMINGTADPLVPYNGGGVGFGRGRGDVWSVRKTAEFFARRGGCGKSSAVVLPGRSVSEGTTMTRISWQNCLMNAGVTLYRIDGGGHALPGRGSIAPRLLGLSNFDIESADVILDAFDLDRSL